MKIGQEVYVIIAQYKQGPSYDPSWHVDEYKVTGGCVVSFDSETVAVWHWKYLEPDYRDKKQKLKMRLSFLPHNEVYLTEEAADAAVKELNKK